MKLEIMNLNKYYGNLHALNNFSYSFENGIYGILGPNGAGKSSLVKIICQLIKSDSGEIVFNDKKIDNDFKKYIGVMPQQQELYPNFTINEFMYYMSALKGLKKKDADNQIKDLLEIVKLDEAKHKKIHQLSGGMKQRLLIAQTLLGNPPILIFDEPTAGLDPNQRIEIRNFFSTLSKDHIILITTHVVQDVESIADHIIFLKNGVIIKSGSPANIIDEIDGHVKEVEIEEDKLKTFDMKQISVLNHKKDRLVARIITSEKFNNERIVYPTLEDAYLFHVGEEKWLN